MHTFQPYPMDLLEMNPFTKIGKEWALITSGDRNQANLMTVSWGGVGVIWGKNVVYIFIRDSRYTREFIESHEFFSMSFLDKSFRPSMNICGAISGRGKDKFKEAGLTPAFRHSIPYPDEANLVLLCRKMAAVPLTEDTFTDSDIMEKWYSDKDMHTMYVGEIIEAIAR